MTTATTTNPTTTTATYKKLNALSDPEACSNFLMNIKNKLRGARVLETVDGVKTDRGNLTRLLNSRVYPVAGGRERLGVEDITAPANLGGDWGADLADQAEEAVWAHAYEITRPSRKQCVYDWGFRRNCLFFGGETACF